MSKRLAHPFDSLHLRPYKCLIPGCGFTTSDPGSLNRHEKRRHGYPPRRRTGSWLPASIERTTRRQKSIPPHTIPESYPSSSLLPIGDHLEEGSRNMFPAYDSQLTVRYAPANDSLFALESRLDDVSLTSTSGVLNPSDVPVAMHPHQLMTEQGGYYTFNGATHTLSNGVCGNLSTPFGDWLPQVAPPYYDATLSFPSVQHAVENASVPTAESLSPALYTVNGSLMSVSPLPSSAVSCTTDHTWKHTASLSPTHGLEYGINHPPAPTPASWTIPGSEVQCKSSSYEYDDVASATASFEAYFNSSQHNSFSTPGMGFYPQAQSQAVHPGAVVDLDQDCQSYLYTTSADTTFGEASTSDDFRMQGLYPW